MLMGPPVTHISNSGKRPLSFFALFSRVPCADIIRKHIMQGRLNNDASEQQSRARSAPLTSDPPQIAPPMLKATAESAASGSVAIASPADGRAASGYGTTLSVIAAAVILTVDSLPAPARLPIPPPHLHGRSPAALLQQSPCMLAATESPLASRWRNRNLQRASERAPWHASQIEETPNLRRSLVSCGYAFPSSRGLLVDSSTHNVSGPPRRGEQHIERHG